MRFDSVQLHQIWRETTNKLDSLARDVRENKRVMEASDFARWLQFSGILTLLEAYPQAAPLRVDAASVRKQIRDLIWDCGERFKNGKADAQYAASDIAEINRKLDIVAAHISRLQPATSSPPLTDTTVNAGDSAEPVLRVMQGGVL